MSKGVFYVDSNFLISTEHWDEDRLVVHCEVVNWKHSVLKVIYREVAKLIEEAREGGYKSLDTFSPNPKFCELVCFTYSGLDFDHNGTMHSHYTYDLRGVYGG